MPRPLNILLIEDSAEIRESLVQRIEASGRLLVSGWADTSHEAIRLLDLGNIDAVIVDLHLRQGTGLLVLAHLQHLGNPLHILRIVFTNHTTSAFRRTCANLGAEYFLDKSLEFDRAIEILEAHAQQRVSVPSSH
jgi:DNA-binding NarL/FixJ family response regulator